MCHARQHLLTFNHRRTGQFVSRGLTGRVIFTRKYLESARKKTAMLTCKTVLPDSPHPVIISKTSRISGTSCRWTEWIPFFSFNKYKKIFFFTFGCWLLPEKISVFPKNNGFARFRGLQSPAPDSYVYASSTPPKTLASPNHNGVSELWSQQSTFIKHVQALAAALCANILRGWMLPSYSFPSPLYGNIRPIRLLENNSLTSYPKAPNISA